MVSIASLAGMAVVALGMVLTPGPNMMYLVSRSIGQGWRAGMISLAGTATGFLVYMTMANVGLAAVFVVVPALYVAVKAAGAAYLLWLAWQALRPGGKGVFETRALSPDSRWVLYRKGLVTNLLNPKAAVMYMALIPQFVRPDRGHTMAQGLELGGVQIAVSMIVNSGIIAMAGRIGAFLSARPAWTRWQRRLSGALLGSVAVELVLHAPARAAA
jgi:threonine/homoserine/homoserine lactone efflux protein